MVSVSFDSASKAIHEAHDWSRRLRIETVTGRSSPICVWRRKLTKADLTKEVYRYTLSPSWEERPEGAGLLCMTVSASGTEILEGPWLNEKGELVRALKS